MWGIAIPLERLGAWQRQESLRSIEHRNGLRAFQVDVRFDPEVLSSKDAADRIEEALAPVREQRPGFHIQAVSYRSGGPASYAETDQPVSSSGLPHRRPPPPVLGGDAGEGEDGVWIQD